MKRLWALTIGCALLTALLVMPGVYRASPAPQTEKPAPGGKRPFAAREEEKKAIGKTVAAFAAAFGKGDVEALVSLWTEDGEFVHESGKVYRGREAIRVLMKKAVVAFKGYTQTLKMDSVRFIRPEVALVEGTSASTSPEGVIDSGKYSAILVKDGDKWLFESIRDVDEAKEEDKFPAYEKLRQLGWMVGEWTDKDGKGEVTVSCKWGPDQTYLLQDVAVKQDDGKVLHLNIRIGWDPTTQQIRSWVFDSTGGYGGGLWTRDGNTWNVASEGVYADGRTGTSADSWKYVDATNAVWSSKSREANEEPQPDIVMPVVRKSK